jgi:hypothetical protein
MYDSAQPATDATADLQTLKSACRIETARLRTAERLTKLIAPFCTLSWAAF